jgi:alpha-glucosidase (family GH31 glycosyl hydrolase)
MNNLKLRYALLKHYFTQFVDKRGLGTIWKPLFFVYPQDDNTYIDEVSDTQFMIGNNLLAAPIVEQGQTSRKVYFP